MRILASLSCVDCVVLFTEDTPERLIRRLMPDILVKGGDYTEEEVVGGEFIKAVGGEVSIIGFLQGHSTTDIINRIKRKLMIIVTGGAGFIGSNIIAGLNARGITDIMVVDHL